jgi:hypothetical protein
MSKKKKPKLTRRTWNWYRQILNGGPGPDSWVTNPGFRELGWAAAVFATKWRSRDINIKKLQTLVLKSGSAECAYHFAKNVPGANVKKLTEIVIKHGSSDLMRTFAREISGADKELLENWASIYDTFFA